jgi:hypothetical protein
MEEAISPVTNYVFGAFALILLGVLVRGVLLWRTDHQENARAAAENAHACSEALTDNAVANTKLSRSLDEMTRANHRLHEELLRRPCVLEVEGET